MASAQPGSRHVPPRARLTRDDWVQAALLAIAEGGTAAVAVEPLAARLGATKGSFYWHFGSRAELVAAALAAWEHRATDEFGAVDAALLASAADPTVAPVVERVQAKRLAFLERCFRDMEVPRAARLS